MTTEEELKEMMPDQALHKLKEGNARFVEKGMLRRDHAREVASTSEGQNPFALIHGCIDSRTPAETIFDQGIGDIFHTRVAGNVINEDVLGGMEYACGKIGTPLVLIMGHTSCGAVRAACDGIKMGNLTGLLEKIRPSIEEVSSEVSPSDPAFADLVGRAHVKRAISEILSRSEIVKALVEQSKVAVKGALYDVKGGRVEWL